MGTFCLVHGAWHDDACWEPLVAELERRGHESLTPVLPLDHRPPYRRAGYRPPPVDASGRSWWPHDRAVTELYGRIDRPLAERLAARLRPQPQGLFGAPYPLEHPPEVHSALLYTREDELFEDHWSRWISQQLLGVEAIELPGGHFPMLEHPNVLADTLEQVHTI